jgi:hypothetical protein
VLRASVVPRRIARATTIFAFLAILAEGTSAAEAWRRSSSMTLRTGYRIRHALALAGPGLRTALLSRAPPPSISSASPDAQLLAHVRAALGADVSSFDRFQRAGLPHAVFTADALALVVRASEGVLRRVRNLCLGALLEAVRDRTKTVDLKQINRVLLQPHWRENRDAA